MDPARSSLTGHLISLPGTARRRTIVSGMTDSIDDTLGADHERLHLLLRRLQEWPSRGNLDGLERGLGPHMVWEEKVLFPAVRALLNAAQKKSLESLEIDHERLRETLASIRVALEAVDLPLARQRIDLLAGYVEGHNADEERGVYVEADRLLDSAQRTLLLDSFRTGPPS